MACAGHLLEFEEPAEIDTERWGSPWREEVLPILPRPWPKVVADGKEGLVRTIAKMLREADLVVHAGDPDDEGQLIIDELLEFLGWSGPVMRVMVNDSIDRNIRRAFENMEPNGPHMAAGRSSNARRMADACFGFNESRLASIRAGHGRKLTVGRVQTPTLGLVVERTLEVRRPRRERVHEDLPATSRLMAPLPSTSPSSPTPRRATRREGSRTRLRPRGSSGA